MSTATYRLNCEENGVAVALCVVLAESAWKRLVGLIGWYSLEEHDGLWLKPCNSIHTIGMRFPIDALFLNEDLRVVRAVSRISPLRVVLPVRGARSVVELAAGTLERGDIGEGTVMRMTANR